MWLIYHVKIILILFLNKISHQKIPGDSGIAVNLPWLSTIKEVKEVVKEVVLPEVSELNDSVMNKNHKDQTQFSPEKKTLEKGKWVS